MRSLARNRIAGMVVALGLWLLGAAPVNGQALLYGPYAMTGPPSSCFVCNDLTGDGVRDILVGRIGQGVSVYSGANGTVWMDLVAPPVGAHNFGELVVAGDLDGDGIDEVITSTGTPGYIQGTVYIYSGAAVRIQLQIDLPGSPLLGSTPTAIFGHGVDTADLDGNGVSELLVAAHPETRVFSYDLATGTFATVWFQPAISGSPHITVGSYAGPGSTRNVLVSELASGAVGTIRVYSSSGATLGAVTPVTTQDAYFGTRVEACGDLNGDGAEDFGVCAPSEHGPGGSRRGAAYFFSGATLAMLAGSPVYGLIDNEAFGTAIAALGDLNQDGVNEIAVSARQTNSGPPHGFVKILSGATLWTLATINDPLPANYNYGYAIDGGDVTGDGCPELVVTSLNSQLVYVYSSLLGCAPPPPPFTLTINRPFGGGSLGVTLANGGPNQPYFTALTFDPSNANGGMGTGWWFGLHLTFTELVWEISFPAGSPPFRDSLSPAGGAVFTLPAGTLPPYLWPLLIYGVSVTFDPMTGYLSLVSNPASG